MVLLIIARLVAASVRRVAKNGVVPFGKKSEKVRQLDLVVGSSRLRCLATVKQVFGSRRVKLLCVWLLFAAVGDLFVGMCSGDGTPVSTFEWFTSLILVVLTFTW